MLADLTNTQLEYSAPQIDTRSIRDVAIHTYRPVLAVACVLTGEGWPARPELATTKDDLLQLLHSMNTHINACISRLTPDLLEQSISLPWKQQQQGLDAFIECCTHGFFHVGVTISIRDKHTLRAFILSTMSAFAVKREKRGRSETESISLTLSFPQMANKKRCISGLIADHMYSRYGKAYFALVSYGKCRRAISEGANYRSNLLPR